MIPKIGFVLLAPAWWLAGAAATAQAPCGVPEGSAPRIDGASPVALLRQGAEVCVCGAFPDPAAVRGLRLDGRPVEATVDAFGRVATLRLPPDLAPGSYEITGTPEAAYRPEDRAEIRLIDVRAERCEHFFSCGRHRRVCVAATGSEEPVALQVANRNPDRVALLGGTVQEIATSGGSRNRAVLEGRATGEPGHWTLGITPAGPPCPCAAGGEEGLPPERVAELEACLQAAVAEIEAWFDGRARELAARAERGVLAPAEVVALLDELERRFLRVLATPDLAALRAWVEDELGRERERWRGNTGATPDRAARFRRVSLMHPAPSVVLARDLTRGSVTAFLDGMSQFFNRLGEVSTDLVVDLCVRSDPPRRFAWVQPKRYREGRRESKPTHTEFRNLTRGIYAGLVEDSRHPASFTVDLVSEFFVYVDCCVDEDPCCEGGDPPCEKGTPRCAIPQRPRDSECVPAGHD